MGALTDVIAANEDQVAAKVMDGEAILINLATGAYYSTPGTGGFIWSLIEQKLTVGDIAHAVSQHFDVTRAAAELDVLRLTDHMRAEGLVITVPVGGDVGAAPPPPAERAVYLAPNLEKFTDMAEMFALDPPLPGLSTVKPADAGRN